MSRTFLSLKEHMKGFSAVNLSAEAAAVALEENLLRYGQVRSSHFPTFGEAINYLLPLKSFTTRFLMLGHGSWTFLITDMRGENCHVDAYTISRTTLCKAIGLFLQEERRELHVFVRGDNVRQVQSLRDGDRWYYREAGQLQMFEDSSEYLPKKKIDRLGVATLERYFQKNTGFKIPDWKKARFISILGLE